jgi:hypothetical protein
VSALRRIGAVIAGLIGAWIPVGVAESVTHKLYPPAASVDMHDFAQVKLYVASLPTTAYVLVLLGWALGTVIGTYVATRIGLTNVTGYIVGAILLAAGLYNAYAIPQPLWFSAVSFVIFIGMTFVGVALARPRIDIKPGSDPAGV